MRIVQFGALIVVSASVALGGCSAAGASDPVGLDSLATSVSTQSHQGNAVPFHAQDTAIAQPGVPCRPPPHLLICVTATGSGQATHLGGDATSEHLIIDLDLTVPHPGGCINRTDAVKLTAANGDEVHLNATGTQCATGTAANQTVGTYVIAGGTGRFADATGTGTWNANLVPGADGLLVATTVFDGNIDY